MLPHRHNPKRHRFLLSLLEEGIAYLSEVEIFYERDSFRHAHDEVQLLWMLEGELGMDAGGRVFELGPGSACVIPPGLAHQVLLAKSRRVVVLDVRLAPAAAPAMVRFALPFADRGAATVPAKDLKQALALLRRAVALAGPARVASVVGAVWTLLGTLAAAREEPPAHAPPVDGPRAPATEYHIRLADDFMRDQLHNAIDVDDVARLVNLSRSQLTRLYGKHMGISPGARLKQLRIAQAKQLLASSTLSVKEVAVVCGFECPNYFSRAFRDATGSPPLTYRGANRPAGTLK